MFTLKESVISGGKYFDINQAEDFSSLLHEARKRYDEHGRRWVIVNPEDEIQAYSDDMKSILDDINYKLEHRQELPRMVVEDVYLIRLLQEKEAPYCTTMELMSEVLANAKRKKKKKRHNLVFGKNARE